MDAPVEIAGVFVTYFFKSIYSLEDFGSLEENCYEDDSF